MDDHAIVREGLRRVVGRDGDIEVVGGAASLAEARQQLDELAPDVVLLDVSLPDGSGLSAIPEFKAAHPDLRILVLSMHTRPEYVLQAVRAGADGYASKEAEPRELREGLRSVAAGKSFLPPGVVERLGEGVRLEASQDRLQAQVERLTPRERDVIVSVASGLTSQEIGDALGISRRTVESHRERIMRKLEINTIAGLTRFVIEAGLDS